MHQLGKKITQDADLLGAVLDRLSITLQLATNLWQVYSMIPIGNQI